MQIIRSQGSVACVVYGAAPATDIGSCLRNGDHVDRLSHGASAIASAVMDGCDESEVLTLCIICRNHNVGLCASSCIHDDPSVHTIIQCQAIAPPATSDIMWDRLVPSSL